MNTGHTHTSSIFNDVYTTGIFTNGYKILDIIKVLVIGQILIL